MEVNHQRASVVDGKSSGHKTNSKVIHKTTSESLRLSMTNGAIDNSNKNYSSGLNSNLVGQTTQTQSSSMPVTANVSQNVLLMTNNGKNQQQQLQQQNSSAKFVTIPDLNMDLKPKNSYQITSITVGTRTSDEDSADDLDESHTTDENSRVTDMENETPSYSEDTYSKDDVFATAYAHGMVPIIPTNNMSADLTNCVNSNNNPMVNSAVIGGGGNGNGNGGTKKMPDVRVNCVTAAVDKNKGVEIKGSERFKVVKIESIEPFKRGRWTCMDYLDQSAKQVQMNFGGGTAKTVTTNDSGVVLTDNYNNETTVANANKMKKQSTAKTVPAETMQPTQNQPINVGIGAPNATQHLISGQSAPGGGMQPSENSSPGQTLQQPMQVVSQPATMNTIVQQINENNAHHNANNIQSTSHAQTLSHHSYNNATMNTTNFQPMATLTTVSGQSLPQQQLHQIMSHVLPPHQQNQQPTQQNIMQQPTIQHFQSAQQQYANTSMGGSQSAHATQTIPMQQIHEIHQYQQQYQNNLQHQQTQSNPQQFYGQIANDNNANGVYQQKPQYQSQPQIQQYSNPNQYHMQQPAQQVISVNFYHWGFHLILH